MSNPSIATKLITLVKGIFGRKEPVPAPVPAKDAGQSVEAEQTPQTEGEVKETAKEEKRAEAPAKPVAEEKEEETASETPAERTEKAEKTEEPEASAKSAAPATEDVPEGGEEIAEELEVAEAHTTVADDEVLEKVRKEASPAAEDLAVPTYDELTLPSIRARLRKLTVEQVRDLRAYEVAHQGRPEFVKMYDNRIAKLEAEA